MRPTPDPMECSTCHAAGNLALQAAEFSRGVLEKKPEILCPERASNRLHQ